MKKAIAVMVAVAMAGCISAKRGDFQITSIGDDIKGDITYVRVDSNGVGEAFIFSGNKNATESTHTVANATCAIIGAIIGSGTPVTPAGGAAIGGGASEAWQSIKDWLKKKSAQPVQPPTISTTNFPASMPAPQWILTPAGYTPSTLQLLNSNGITGGGK